jgi:diguanylate cyclase (GGDEF)-like protein/PAS domain S-box-containing protein
MDTDALHSLLAALEQALDGIVIIDENNLITHFNAAAERLWDRKRVEVLGHNVKILVPELLRPDDGLTDASRPPGISRIVGSSRELKIEREDGATVWGAFSLSRVEVAGKISYMCFIRDVTADVCQRAQLELMSLVADHTDRSVIVMDGERRIDYVNSAFTELFGYSRDEAMGHIPGTLLGGAYTDVAVLQRLEAQVRTEDHGQEDILVYDKAGHEVWVSSTINAVRNDDGDVKNLVAVLADITQSKQIQSLQYLILEALADDMPVLEVIDALCRRVEVIAPDIVTSVIHVDAGQRVQPLGAPSFPRAFLESLEGVELPPDLSTPTSRSSGMAAMDIATDPWWAPIKVFPLAAGLRTCWSTPIKAKDSRVIGILGFFYRDLRAPTRWHQTILDACVHLCALAIERHEARLEIAQLVYFDALTGLPNRERLRQTMSQLIEVHPAADRLAVMYIDLDNFKEVNDSMGHLTGDKLLVSVTQRLQSQLRPGDTMSRQGGDEFIVLLPECDADGAATIAGRMLESLKLPIQLGSRQVQVLVSIGISLYPDNAVGSEMLLKHADAAMYKVKQTGGGAFRFFATDMNAVAEERLALSTSLRLAILRGDLRLHYQPQIRTADGSLYGVEALARWHDPVLGDVPPSKFIPLAEESGLIEMIGVWSLRESCRQVAAWRNAGIDVPCISVNLSPIDFQQGDLATLVAEIIAEYDLPPEMLMLEITEGVVMKEDSNALRTMQKIRDTGVGLSMDDFGTGYSSLNRLAYLPIRELKIDRSFMRDIETEASALAITTAVVRVGQSLNMTVIAEGVETEGQRRILTELGCNVIQGYLYSPAMSAPDLEAWLRQRAPQQPQLNADAASRRAALKIVS